MIDRGERQAKRRAHHMGQGGQDAKGRFEHKGTSLLRIGHEERTGEADELDGLFRRDRLRDAEGGSRLQQRQECELQRLDDAPQAVKLFSDRNDRSSATIARWQHPNARGGHTSGGTLAGVARTGGSINAQQIT